MAGETRLSFEKVQHYNEALGKRGAAKTEEEIIEQIAAAIRSVVDLNRTPANGDEQKVAGAIARFENLLRLMPKVNTALGLASGSAWSSKIGLAVSTTLPLINQGIAQVKGQLDSKVVDEVRLDTGFKVIANNTSAYSAVTPSALISSFTKIAIDNGILVQKGITATTPPFESLIVGALTSIFKNGNDPAVVLSAAKNALERAAKAVKDPKTQDKLAAEIAKINLAEEIEVAKQREEKFVRATRAYKYMSDRTNVATPEGMREMSRRDAYLSNFLSEEERKQYEAIAFAMDPLMRKLLGLSPVADDRQRTASGNRLRSLITFVEEKRKGFNGERPENTIRKFLDDLGGQIKNPTFMQELELELSLIGWRPDKLVTASFLEYVAMNVYMATYVLQRQIGSESKMDFSGQNATFAGGRIDPTQIIARSKSESLADYTILTDGPVTEPYFIEKMEDYANYISFMQRLEAENGEGMRQKRDLRRADSIRGLRDEGKAEFAFDQYPVFLRNKAPQPYVSPTGLVFVSTTDDQNRFLRDSAILSRRGESGSVSNNAATGTGKSFGMHAAEADMAPVYTRAERGKISTTTGDRTFVDGNKVAFWAVDGDEARTYERFRVYDNRPAYFVSFPLAEIGHLSVEETKQELKKRLQEAVRQVDPQRAERWKNFDGLLEQVRSSINEHTMAAAAAVPNIRQAIIAHNRLIDENFKDYPQLKERFRVRPEDGQQELSIARSRLIAELERLKIREASTIMLNLDEYNSLSVFQKQVIREVIFEFTGQHPDIAVIQCRIGATPDMLWDRVTTPILHPGRVTMLNPTVAAARGEFLKSMQELGVTVEGGTLEQIAQQGARSTFEEDFLKAGSLYLQRSLAEFGSENRAKKRLQLLIPSMPSSDTGVFFSDEKLRKLSTETGIKVFMWHDEKGNFHGAIIGDSGGTNLSVTRYGFGRGIQNQAAFETQLKGTDSPRLMIYPSNSRVGGDFGEYSQRPDATIVILSPFDSLDTSELQQEFGRARDWQARAREDAKKPDSKQKARRYVYMPGFNVTAQQTLTTDIESREGVLGWLNSVLDARGRIRQCFLDFAFAHDHNPKNFTEIVNKIDVLVDYFMSSEDPEAAATSLFDSFGIDISKAGAIIDNFKILKELKRIQPTDAELNQYRDLGGLAAVGASFSRQLSEIEGVLNQMTITQDRIAKLRTDITEIQFEHRDLQGKQALLYLLVTHKALLNAVNIYRQTKNTGDKKRITDLFAEYEKTVAKIKAIGTGPAVQGEYSIARPQNLADFARQNATITSGGKTVTIVYTDFNPKLRKLFSQTMSLGATPADRSLLYGGQAILRGDEGIEALNRIFAEFGVISADELPALVAYKKLMDIQLEARLRDIDTRVAEAERQAVAAFNAVAAQLPEGERPAAFAPDHGGFEMGLRTLRDEDVLKKLGGATPQSKDALRKATRESFELYTRLSDELDGLSGKGDPKGKKKPGDDFDDKKPGTMAYRLVAIEAVVNPADLNLEGIIRLAGEINGRMEAVRAQLQAARNAAAADAVEAKAKHEKAQAELQAELQTERDGRATEAQAAREATDKAKRELEAAETERAELARQLEELRKAREKGDATAESRIAELEGQLKAAQDETAQRRIDLEKAAADAVEAKAKHEKAQAELQAELQTERDGRATEAQAAREATDKAKRELEAAETERAELARQLEELRKAREKGDATAESRIAELEGQLKAAQDETAQRRIDLEKAAADAVEAKAKHEKAQAELQAELQTERDGRATEAQAAREATDKAKRELEAAETERAELARQLEELRKAREKGDATAESRIAELEGQLKAAQDETAQRRIDLEKAAADAVEAKAKHEKAQAELQAELQTERDGRATEAQAAREATDKAKRELEAAETERAELARQLEELRKAREKGDATAESRIAELEGQLKAAQDETAQRRIDLEKAAADAVEAKAKHEKAQAELQAELQTERDGRATEAQAAREATDKAKRELEAAETERAELARQLEELRKAREKGDATAESRIAELEGQLKAAQDETAQRRIDLEKAAADAVEAKAKHEKAQAELQAELQTERDGREAEKVEAGRLAREAQKRFEDKEAERARLEGELARAQKRADDLNAELEKAKVERQGLVAQMAEARGAAEGSAGELGILRERTRHLNGEVARLEGELKAAKEEVERKRKEILDNVSKDAERVRAIEKEIENKLRALNTELDEVRKKAAEFEAKAGLAEQAKGAANASQAEIAGLKERIKNLEVDKTRLTGVYEEARKGMEETEQSIAKLRAEFAENLRKEQEAARKNLLAAEERESELRALLARVTAERDGFKTQMLKLEASGSGDKATIAALEERVRELERVRADLNGQLGEAQTEAREKALEIVDMGRRNALAMGQARDALQRQLDDANRDIDRGKVEKAAIEGRLNVAVAQYGANSAEANRYKVELAAAKQRIEDFEAYRKGIEGRFGQAQKGMEEADRLAREAEDGFRRRLDQEADAVRKALADERKRMSDLGVQVAGKEGEYNAAKAAYDGAIRRGDEGDAELAVLRERVRHLHGDGARLNGEVSGAQEEVRRKKQNIVDIEHARAEAARSAAKAAQKRLDNAQRGIADVKAQIGALEAQIRKAVPGSAEDLALRAELAGLQERVGNDGRDVERLQKELAAAQTAQKEAEARLAAAQAELNRAEMGGTSAVFGEAAGLGSGAGAGGADSRVAQLTDELARAKADLDNAKQLLSKHLGLSPAAAQAVFEALRARNNAEADRILRGNGVSGNGLSAEIKRLKDLLDEKTRLLASKETELYSIGQGFRIFDLESHPNITALAITSTGTVSIFDNDSYGHGGLFQQIKDSMAKARPGENIFASGGPLMNKIIEQARAKRVSGLLISAVSPKVDKDGKATIYIAQIGHIAQAAAGININIRAFEGAQMTGTRSYTIRPTNNPTQPYVVEINGKIANPDDLNVVYTQQLHVPFAMRTGMTAGEAKGLGEGVHQSPEEVPYGRV